MRTAKKKAIDKVLGDLESLRRSGFENTYALDENVRFFNAARNIFSYAVWLFSRAPYIDGRRLLEINDFPMTHWDREMHQELIKVEKKKFPGLIEPLVQRLSEHVLSAGKEPVTVASLGSGGMETELQVLNRVCRQNILSGLTIVAIDRSPLARQVARENLKELGDTIAVHEYDQLDETTLDQIRELSKKKHQVVMCGNDIFNLKKAFRMKTFDILFNAFFRHHLHAEQSRAMLEIAAAVAKKVFIYDGYRNWFLMAVPHAISAWHSPIFLNATIFSDLRYKTRSDILRSLKTRRPIDFYSIGTYLAELEA